jgi:hypothetical protein
LTLLAYGQTGSGKSYSMFGKEPKLRDDNGRLLKIEEIQTPAVGEQGLIPRCISYTYSWLLKHRSNDTFFEFNSHSIHMIITSILFHIINHLICKSILSF